MEETTTNSCIRGNNIRDDDVVGAVKFVPVTTITKSCLKTNPPNDN